LSSPSPSPFSFSSSFQLPFPFQASEWQKPRGVCFKRNPRRDCIDCIFQKVLLAQAQAQEASANSNEE
jgi:hypothetical protein